MSVKIFHDCGDFLQLEIFHECGDVPQVWSLTLTATVKKVFFLKLRLRLKFYPYPILTPKSQLITCKRTHALFFM